MKWNGDVLSFRRSGVAAGTLSIFEGEAMLEMTLEGMLKIFVAKIEEKIRKNLKSAFLVEQ